MIVLDTTDKSLPVVMSGAAATTNPDFSADYEDERGSVLVSGNNNGTLNGTSTVTLVAAPADNARRRIQHVIIRNRDTAAVTVTVSLTDTAVARQQFSAAIESGGTLEYS